MRLIIFSICLLVAMASCKEEPKSTNAEEPVEIPQVETHDSIISSEGTISDVSKPRTLTYVQQRTKLVDEGYQVFYYVDNKTGDTLLMQQYFIAFLKKGPVRNQNEEEAAILQEDHLAHLSKMYELGYADISGPMGDNGDIRGITVYNVPTLAMADSLANADPMVKAKRLVVEIHPWWAAKGTPLR